MKQFVFGLAIIATLFACKKEESSFEINPCGISFENSVHYLAIGDEFSGGIYLNEGEAWPNQVQDYIIDEGYNFQELVIMGSANSTSAELLSQLNNSGQTECKNLVSIMAGVHDQLAGNSTVQFQADYTALVNRAIEVADGASNVVCVSLPDYSITPGLPPSAGTPEEAQTMIESYNQIIADICLEKDIAFADIYPISQSAYQILYVPEDQFHADYDHHSLWANIVSGKVNELLN